MYHGLAIKIIQETEQTLTSTLLNTLIKTSLEDVSLIKSINLIKDHHYILN